MWSSRSYSKKAPKQVVQHVPIAGKLGLLSAGLLLAFGLVACGSADPDCGSSATQDLIIQIVQEHRDVIFSEPAGLVGAVLGIRTKTGVGTQAISNSTAGKSISARVASTIQDVCGRLPQGTFALRCASGLSPELSADAGFKALSDEKQQMLNKAREETTFTLDTIRTNSKDADTKAVSCTANLNAKFEDGYAHEEITYKVEKTSDEKLYATIYGL